MKQIHLVAQGRMAALLERPLRIYYARDIWGISNRLQAMLHNVR